MRHFIGGASGLDHSRFQILGGMMADQGGFEPPTP